MGTQARSPQNHVRAISRLATLGVAAFALLTASCKKTPPPPAAPPEVYVAPVIQQDVPVYLELVGQTQGFQDVEIRARVEGWLETVNFREGSFVRKGNLLYQIDQKPFQATLAGARAEVATAQARLEKADNDVTRYTPLVAKQAVSQMELDNARSAQDAARSQVEAAKAAVEQATLNLGYTRIYSPIDGLIDITKVKPGNLVGRGEPTLLTTISQIDPIIFEVGVTEADYLRVAKQNQKRTGAQPRLSGIQLTLSDGTVYSQRGRVGTIERTVDPTTGTLGAQLWFPNPEFILRPGSYGKARIRVDTKPQALLVPQRAVQELQNLYSVAVVKPDNTIEFRNVTVGPRVDTLWVIEKGLHAGDKVVAEGLQAVRDGIRVRPKPLPANGDIENEFFQ
jgi:membrane fusion protein (multidrug efflux system)